VEPALSLEPVAPHRPRGQAHHFRRLLLGEAAKETAFHHLSESRVEGLELRQRLVQCHQRLGSVLNRHHAFVQDQDPRAAATFAGPVPPSVIHQDLPHRPSSDAVEVAPVAVLHAGLIHQPEIGLVDQTGGAEGVCGALVPKGTVRDPAQFLIDQREEPVHDGGVAVAKLQQQLSDWKGRVGWIG